MSEISPLRIALIGAGRWGRRYISTLANMTDRFTLETLVSTNPDSKNLVPQGCLIAQSWLEGLRARPLDGVIIATPPSEHASMLNYCLDHNLPVIVEKPLALNLEEVQTFVAKGKTFKKPLIVDHLYLFHPAYETLKAQLPRIGKILKITTVGGNHGPFRDGYNSLWDYGPHDLSMILDLVPTLPVQVDCKRVHSKQTDAGEVGEVFEIGMEFPGGLRTHSTLGNGMQERIRSFIVEGELATCELYDGPSSVRLNGADVSVPSLSPLENLLHRFADSIQQKPDPRCGLDMALKVTQILAQCEKRCGT